MIDHAYSTVLHSFSKKVQKQILTVDGMEIRPMNPRVCLKIHSRHLHAPLRGIFGPNSLNVAHYAAFIWAKSPTKCDAQLPESNFQTRSREYPLLEDFLYDAIYLPEGAPKPPGEIINQPELAVYISDFGQPDELCMVAEACGHILGAVWAKTDARLTCKTVFVRFSTWDVLFFYHKDTNTFDRYPISAIELQNIDMNARFHWN